MPAMNRVDGFGPMTPVVRSEHGQIYSADQAGS